MMGWAGSNLSEADRERIAGSLFKVMSNSGPWLNGLCPFHEDKEPSFGYDFVDDVFHCHAGCSKDGDLVELYCRVNNVDNKSGFVDFKGKYGTGDVTPLSPRQKSKKTQDTAEFPISIAQTFSTFPVLPDDWVERLGKIRGWTRETMARLDLRKQTMYQPKTGGNPRPVRGDRHRVAIPIRDAAGELHNIRLYDPAPDAKMKIISWAKGFGNSRLFPHPGPKWQQNGPVLICEGEADTICAISNGFEAYTQTSKTMKWKKEHQEPFAGRDVIVCYDADKPGVKYAQAAAANLAPVAKSVRVLSWPSFMLSPDGKIPEKHGQDLTDFFVRHKKTRKDLEGLFLLADEVSAPAKEIDDSVYQYFRVSESGRATFIPRWLADRIIDDLSPLYDPRTGLFYRWTGKFWKIFEPIEIKRQCILALGNESRRGRVEDAFEHIKTLGAIPEGVEMNKSDYIAVRNGMVRVEIPSPSSDDPDPWKMIGDIVPHRKEYYCTCYLDIDFNPEVAGPEKTLRWIKFLHQVIGKSHGDLATIAQMQEFVGYCFTRATKYEKMLFLVGDGQDGKSTFLKILRMLVGRENSASISFEELEDQFYRSILHNKLLNISTEVGSKALESKTFKAVVTGDSIMAAFKNQTPFEFSPYCKLAFAANKLPRVLDNTFGYYRRLLPIRFPKSISDEDKDVDLLNKLAAELPEIFRWALDGLVRLEKNQKFTDSDNTEELLMEHKRQNNPLISFVEDKCCLGPNMTAEKSELYDAYKSYCSKNNYRALANRQFFKELKQAVKDVNLNKRFKKSGKLGPRVVEGLALSA